MINPDKLNCCGCGVCAYVCGHSAITMEPDALGFNQAKVNLDACTDCGLCEKICPFNNTKDSAGSLPQVYAVRHKQPEIVDLSRSGGCFTAISDFVLNEGGTVYGAALTADMRVEHIRATNPSERNRMRGSKYSQSILGNICISVKRDLTEGRKVLFSGTPCQVTAIERYVGKRLRDNLILVDVICHGAGSPEIWRQYIAHIEKAEGRKVLSADFRDKNKYGWDGLHKESFVIEGKPCRQYYPYIYYNDLHVMECCSNCPYTCIPRHSDITLGDLWGFEKVVPDWVKGNNGISLVLVNTDKGRELFAECMENVDFRPLELSAVMQPHLRQPIKFNALKREEYIGDFNTLPFEAVLEKYHGVHRPSVWNMMRNKLKQLLVR